MHHRLPTNELLEEVESLRWTRKLAIGNREQTREWRSSRRLGCAVSLVRRTWSVTGRGTEGASEVLTEALLVSSETEEEHAFLRQQYEHARWSFHPTETYVNSDRPRVRRMVSALLELGHETLKV